MGGVKQILFACALALSFPASAQEAQVAAAAPVAATGEETSVGAQVTDSERMVVQVTIAGAGPYPFIVDTGAERSVVARDLAEELALPPAGRARVLTLADSREASMVRVRDLAFAPGRGQDLVAFAFNREHVGAAGIIGIDALHGQRVVLDFAANTLHVGPAPSRSAERFGADDIVVRARRRYGQLVLVDSDADGAPVDVVIDSGLAVSVGNEALRRLLVSRRRQFTDLDLVSVTGETLHAEYTRVDNLRIGGFAVQGLPVAFSDAYFFQRLNLTRRPALMLGMDALQMFERVDVDFPNRRAVFRMRPREPEAR